MLCRQFPIPQIVGLKSTLALKGQWPVTRTVNQKKKKKGGVPPGERPLTKEPVDYEYEITLTVPLSIRN